MRLQSTKSKLGEVHYRSKIVRQQLGTNTSIKNEPTTQEFKNALKSKLKETEKTFRKLQKSGHHLSPYLEIGSEHCLRPALLEQKFKASGFATDISLHSLVAAPLFAKQFKLKKVPRRICADANNLPFKSNSFPFILVYESLHHFPHPKPILEEIYRVTAPGGICLVGSDPVKQSLQIKLWRRPNKLRAWEKILKILLILPFISHIGKTEVEHGILEESFPLSVWQESLDVFDKAEVSLKAFPFGPSQKLIKTSQKNWLQPNLKTSIVLYFLGGGLQAILKKTAHGKAKAQSQIENLIICPDCLKSKTQEFPLEKQQKSYTCPNCKSVFPIYKNVPVILEKRLKSKIVKTL